MSESLTRVSTGRTKEFYSLFKSIESSERLLDSFVCAFQKEILIQGRLYVTTAHICFHANILGWVTNVVVPFEDIVSIEPKNTAILFPNAILIATLHHRYIFASFIFRDQALKLITDSWKTAININDEKDSLLACLESKALDENAKKRNENLKELYPSIDCGIHQSIILHSFTIKSSREAFLEKLYGIKDAKVEDALFGSINFKQSFITQSECDLELEVINNELNLIIPLCLRITFHLDDAESLYIQGRLEFYIPSQIVFRDSFSSSLNELFLRWLEKYLLDSRMSEHKEIHKSTFKRKLDIAILVILILFLLGALAKLRATNNVQEFDISLLNDIIVHHKQRMLEDSVKLHNLMK